MSASPTVATREYELVLMLDPEMPEERREQIASDARKRIESAGTLKHDTTWGMRKLAYEIQQRTEADYRFFRFETGVEVLDDLSHNLRIADGVLRFRIFKVDPDSPAIAPPAPTASTGPPPRGPRRSQGGPGREAPAAEKAPAPAPEKEPSPPTEPADEQEPSPSTEPAEEQEPSPPAEEGGDGPTAEAEPESPTGQGGEPEATG